MKGSNYIIIERMKSGVFSKFAKHILAQNGYTNFKNLYNNVEEGIILSASYDSKSVIIKIVMQRGVLHLPDFKSMIDYLVDYKTDLILVFSNSEFSDETNKFAEKNDMMLFGRIEIEKWLSGKFDSCISFIDYLDENEIKKTGKYTAVQLIDHYNRLKEKIKFKPNEHQMRYESFIGSGSYNYKWGTWNNFIASIEDNVNLLNIKPNRTQTASTLDLIESYIHVRKELNRPPDAVDIDNSGKYPSDFYIKRFGSWSNFIMIIENEIEKSLKLTMTEMYAEFLLVKNKLGKAPTFTDMRLHSTLSPVALINKFGTWNKFLAAVDERPQFNDIDDKSFIKAFFELKSRLRKIPSYTDFKFYYKFTSETFELKFGQWSNFMRLMQNPEFATLEIREIDVFTDYYRIRNILNKNLITVEEITKYTLFSIQDYLKIFETWNKFFETIGRIDNQSELISKEELIYDYLDLLVKLNSTSLMLFDLMHHSNYFYPIYLCKFKSWAAFVIELKNYIRLSKRQSPVLNEELINDYYRIEKLLNKSPLTYTDMQEYGKYSISTYESRFGTWKIFLASLGLKSVAEISNDDIINEYQRLKIELKQDVISGGDFVKYSKYSLSVVNNRFGGWINFLEYLKEDRSYYYKPTDQELIDEFYRVKSILGSGRVYRKDIDRLGKYKHSAYVGHFGNWITFLKKLGENTSMNLYTDQDLIDEYYRVKKIINEDYISVKEFNKTSNYSVAPYLKRYNTWNNFIISIGEKPFPKINFDEITNEELIEEYYKVCTLLNKKYATVHEVSKHGKFDRYAYEKRFGKWGRFIEFLKKNESQIPVK